VNARRIRDLLTMAAGVVFTRQKAGCHYSVLFSVNTGK